MNLLKTLVLFCLLFSSTASIATVTGQNLLTQKISNVKPGPKGTVVVFMSAVCPCSNSHLEIVKKLATDFKDFAFVAVHSNFDEQPQVAKTYFQNAAFPFPVISDHDGKLADQFKALKTPHSFLIGPDDKILYKGGVTSSANGESAQTHYLRNALTDLTSGRSVAVAEGRTLGCTITRK